MENTNEQIIQPLTGSNKLNTSNNLKAVELLKKRVHTCLECRVKKKAYSGLLYHVQTRHPEKSAYLLAKTCSICNLVFPNRVFYQGHYLDVHDIRTDEELNA